MCSLCERLNQPCTYSDETVQQHVEPQEDRFDRLEQKVDFIMERLSRNNRSSSSPTLARVPPFPKETSTASNVQLPPRVVLRTIAELYGQYISTHLFSRILTPNSVYHCDCQPLALFAVENLQQNIERYSHETIFAILAITVRFSHDPFFESNQQELSLQYAEISRRQAMSKITEGQGELDFSKYLKEVMLTLFKWTLLLYKPFVFLPFWISLASQETVLKEATTN